MSHRWVGRDQRGTRRCRSGTLGRILTIPMLAAIVFFGIASPALAGDSPTHYMYGSDSNHPTATGSAPIYGEPFVSGGGTYGGYVGEVWTWTDWKGCTSGRAVNTTNVSDANANAGYEVGNTYPLGTSIYWYMAGPGAMPGFNASDPSASEAVTWGKQQAEAAVAHYDTYGPTYHEPVLVMDIETTRTTTQSNGWNQEVNTCGEVTGRTSISSTIDRDVYNGFWDYVYTHTAFYPAVYSAPTIWEYTFGTGTASKIPHSYEWTYDTHSIYADPPPSGWSRSDTPDGGPGTAESASWFGGVDTGYKIGGQWAITTTVSADWDQWYTANWPVT